MAADLNQRVTELQVEALNLLFRQHGLPEICVWWAPGAEELHAAATLGPYGSLAAMGPYLGGNDSRETEIP
jgi:hypothetical protein